MMNEQNENNDFDQKIDPSENRFRSSLDIGPVRDKLRQVSEEFGNIVVGQKELLDLLIFCILCEGHILLEGVPGIAKTLSAKVISKTLKTKFTRIQFTPDLLPSDILGTSIFNMKESVFQFTKGPIFSNVVLIDEINRAPAKTQAALFEVMEEKQISNDGITYKMSYPFIVIATQNPIEQEGTYRLPEAQLDRFLMKIVLDYPSQNEELEILKKYKNQTSKIDLSKVKAILKPKDLKEIRALLDQIHVEEQMMQYITQIIYETRNHSRIYLGGSPRASLGILKTAKVAALMAGRDFIIPDDIQYVAPHVLNHRLILTPDAEMEGLSPFDVIEEILKTLEVPR